MSKLADDPKIIEHVKRLVDSMPPLEGWQRDELRRALSGDRAPSVPKVELRDQPTALYRHFDGTGVLLYVGISNDVAIRTKGHVGNGADWTRYVVESRAEWFPDRETAKAAETKAIQTEDPIFNKSQAIGWQVRQQRYLEWRSE